MTPDEMHHDLASSEDPAGMHHDLANSEDPDKMQHDYLSVSLHRCAV